MVWSPELTGRPFAVADQIYCCWDWNHRERTLEYLKGLDPSYFRTITALLAEQLESDDSKAVSVALRVLYHQAIETLMSLLGAAVQARSVVPAWISKCGTDDLKNVVGRLRSGGSFLTEAGRLDVSFHDLSRDLHRHGWAEDDSPDSTAARFGLLWSRLGAEFLDGNARAEYNALKHGTRVLPGGFTLAIGAEEVPGTPAAPEDMRSMGGSRFGTTFFTPERVGATSWHIRSQRNSLNWLPEPIALRLQLISMSIGNVAAALQADLGADPATLTYTRPTSPTVFDEAWSLSPGVTSFKMDSPIEIHPDDEISRDALRSMLERRTPQASESS